MHSRDSSKRRIELGPQDAERVIDGAQKHLRALESLFGDRRAPAVAGILGQERERIVRDILHLRRRRAAYFGDDLFADPAWDILLELYASELSGIELAVSSLGPLIDVPTTTTLRWLNRLDEEGWIYRVDDPRDGRRVCVHLSEKAMKQLDSYFEMLSPRPI